MRILKAKFDIHTPWYKYAEGDLSNYSQDYCGYLSEKHIFDCGDLCDIEITNDGFVAFLFKLDIEEKEVREICAIFLYFISICNGYNCRFKTTANIDGVEALNFFTYAEEDKTELPLSKDLKYHEIALEDIKSNFGIILNKLFSENRYFILNLLSNYYSMVVYKDFAGNGIYKFRNIITNIESIFTILKKEEYKKFEDKNRQYIRMLAEKTGYSCTELKNHISPCRFSLKDKLKDLFKYLNNYGLHFKFGLDEESERIANTRNFISHLFNENKKYISDKQMTKYTIVFEVIFRMLFLEYFGVDKQIIHSKFLRNKLILEKLGNFFEVDDNFGCTNLNTK